VEHFSKQKIRFLRDLGKIIEEEEKRLSHSLRQLLAEAKQEKNKRGSEQSGVTEPGN